MQTGRPLAQHLDFASQARAHALLDHLTRLLGQLLERFYVGGAHIEQGPGFGSDSIYAGPAPNDPDIKGRLGLLWHLEIGQGGDDSPQAVNGAGRAERAIRVPARTAHNDAPAFGANRTVRDMTQAAVDHQHRA